MTREEWDAEWLKMFNRYYHLEGRSLERARSKAWEEMRKRHGEQPEKTKQGLPWRYRILVKFAGKKLEGLRPREVKTMGQRILNAVIFGAAAVLSALQASGIPKDEQGWLGLAGVFVTAAWGKFSSSSTFISSDRKEWTPEEREKKLGG